MRVAVTGSHGLIGTALLAALRAAGHEAVPIVRGGTRRRRDRVGPARRSARSARARGLDAVVNLAGAGIGDKRWSDEYKRQVLESRTRATTLLADTMAGLDDGPQTLLSGSAIGFYGDRGDEELDESSPPGTGFLAEVAEAWEATHGAGVDGRACASCTCAPGSCSPATAARCRGCCRCSRSASVGASAVAASG